MQKLFRVSFPLHGSLNRKHWIFCQRKKRVSPQITP